MVFPVLQLRTAARVVLRCRVQVVLPVQLGSVPEAECQVKGGQSSKLMIHVKEGILLINNWSEAVMFCLCDLVLG